MAPTRVHAAQVLPYVAIAGLAALVNVGSSSLPTTVALVSLVLWRAPRDLEAKTFFTPLALAAGLSIDYWIILRSAVTTNVLDLLQLAIPASLLIATCVYGTCLGSNVVASRFDGSRLEETANIVLFPIVWSVGWCLLSQYHSLGRLITWTPYKDLQPWRAIMPTFGPMAPDLILALLVTAVMNIKSRAYSPRHELPALIDYSPTPSEASPLLARTRLAGTPQRKRTLYRALCITTVLLGWWMVDHLAGTGLAKGGHASLMPVKLACVLPESSSSGAAPSVADYVSETEIISARGAKVLVWPEGAVYLQNLRDQTELFSSIQSLALRRRANIEIAYTLRATAERLSNSASLVNIDGESLYNYTKQALIPVGESYTFQAGDYPLPKATRTRIPVPGRHSKFLQYGRNITVSTAICHDTSFDSIVRQAFPSDLLLVPSAVFNRRLAWRRVEHLKAQALALRMAILVCDGGHEGVSAFIERDGQLRYWQQGRGSFEISTELLSDGGSFYGTRGELGSIALLFGILVGCCVVEVAFRYALGYLQGLWQEFARTVVARLRRFRNIWSIRRMSSRQEESLI